MKCKLPLFLALGVMCFPSQKASANSYDILDFGAVRSETELSTNAINAAVAKCSTDGGGRVVIPAGRFTSGTIFLQDNVDLHLEAGATLSASINRDDFFDPPAPVPPLATPPGWSALIFAKDATNISISGLGTIDGRGQCKTNERGREKKNRVKNILFVSCHSVSVTGISLKNANHWNQHYLNCEDVTVDRIRVFNHANGNNDGIDIDGCRRVAISNSFIDSDDDGIVLKSTGLVPCEDIVISNCVVSSHANAIKCGTESLGGFRNITISNCVIRPSRSTEKKAFSAAQHGISGISLIVVDGGTMDGVMIDNIVIEGTETPLYVRLANRGRTIDPNAPPPPIGSIRNVQISNVLARSTGNYSASITGIPGGKIEDVSLTNVRFLNRGGLTTADAYDPSSLPPTEKRHDFGGGPPPDKFISHHSQVIEDEKGYPQPTAWRNLPSFGLFIRHVKNIRLSDVTLGSTQPDPRPPIIATDVDHLWLRNLNFTNDDNNKSVLLENVSARSLDATVSVKSDE